MTRDIAKAFAFLLALSSVVLAGPPAIALAPGCDGMAGAARGLCNALCKRGCDGSANSTTCRVLRRHFQRLSNRSLAPCGICRLPRESGPCEAAMPRWWHNAETGACEEFVYGGCGGNANNFESAAACERACADPCGDLTCLPHQACRIYRPTGEPYCADTCRDFPCRPGSRCELQPVQCVRAPCPPVAECVPDVPTCELRPDPGPCRAHIERWFHDASSGRCEPFIWGGCGGNANNFASAEDCARHCARCAPPCRGHQEWRLHAPTGERYCADTCVNFRCEEGQVCALADVVCVQEPCPPVATCVPGTDDTTQD